MRSLPEIIQANSRPQPMTPVRACQVATTLLRHASEDTRQITLTDEQLSAIEVLRRIAASVITHGRPSAARSPRAEGHRP